MSPQMSLIVAAFLVPLGVIISYYDVCYRRIPNPFVLATLSAGLLVNGFFGGFDGAVNSLGGCLIGFSLMFVMHVFGAMGAGDVKLFAAIGSMIGAQLVVPTFVVVAVIGGVLGVISMVRAGQMRETMMRVFHIMVGLLPGQTMPRFAVPADRRHTIPYGVAIMFGSLVSVVIFRA